MNIGIVGLGLIGGSIAMKLRHNHNIYAMDISQESLQYALDNGIIHQAYPDLDKLLSQVEVVFLALYPNECRKFLKENMQRFHPGTIVIEVSGIKSGLVRDVAPIIPNDIEVVFTHPIAGREKPGISNALETLFDGQNFVIVPTKSNQKSTLSTVEMLAGQMGFKNISYLSPREHDEIIAYTSQLAHVIALALMETDDRKYDTGKLIGDSFRDLTRIAMINAPLWSELLLENHKHLVPLIDRLIDKLGKYRNLIHNKDSQALSEQMQKMKTLRLELEKESDQ